MNMSYCLRFMTVRARKLVHSLLFKEVLSFFFGCQGTVFKAFAVLVDEFLEGEEVPYLDGAIVGCGGEVSAVGTEGDGDDIAVVGGYRVYQAAGGGIPQAEGLVAGARDNVSAIGAELGVVDPVGVSFEGEEAGAVGDVP